MKKKQKLIMLLLTIILVVVTGTSTVFAKTTFDDMIFDLQTLGIMTGDENGDLQLDKPVTRAEFAALTIRLMSMDKTAASFTDSSRFKDVPDDHWAKSSINYLTNLNIINGVTEDTFEPEANIDVSAASKILVCALGYDAMAQQLGGYPTGYLSKANELGILDTVDTTVNPITRREVAKMIFNSLDVDLMVVSLGSGGRTEYVVDKGNTFRSKFNISDNGVVTKLTGIVTATADAYLNDPVPGLEEYRIEINDAIYEISDLSYNEYIGQKVDFFVEDENSNVIVSMKPSSETTVTTVKIRDLYDVSSNKVKYVTDESNSYKTINFDKNGYFLYNNRVVDSWDEDTINNMKNGTLVFIDNNDDDIADVIFAKEHSSVIVSSVSAENNTIYFNDGQTIGGKKFIKVDEDEDQRITLFDTDGNRLTVGDVKEGDILTCCESSDGQMIEITVSNNTISGEINGIGSDYILVNGEKYYLEDSSKSLDIVNGNEYEIYVNYDNEVTYLKSNTVYEKYAYVAELYLDDDGETYIVSLVLPDTIQEKTEEVKNEDGGEASTVSTLACQNSEVVKMSLASKVYVNGSSLDASSAAGKIRGKVIIYSVNSQGQLTRATAPEQIGTGTSKYYNSSERTFGKTTGGAFGVDMDTLTICIPKDDPDPSIADYLTPVEMNNGQLYDVTAYDQDTDTHMAKLIVVTMTMKSGTMGLVNTKSKVGMVQECTYEVMEGSDEPVCMVEVLTEDGSSVKYQITEACYESDEFFEPKKGDLISYSLDIEYNMDGIKLLGRMSDDQAYGRTNPRGDYETFFGTMLDIEYNMVSENLNRWVHVISCVAADEETETAVDYEVLKYSGPPIYIYEKRSKESKFATIDDIDIYNDEIFVSAANNSVRAVVVLR